MCLVKIVCLAKQMAMEWAKKNLGVLYGGVYTLCLSKLEPLAVPSLAHTYVAADQSLFSDASLSPPLGIEIQNFKMFLFACVMCMNSASNMSSSEWEERERWNESTEWSCVWVTLCLSKLEHLTPDRWLIFSLPFRLPIQIIIQLYLESESSRFSLCQSLTETWRSASGCMLLLVLVTGGHIVWVWLSFLCAIKKAWFEWDDIFPDPLVNNWINFHD